MCGLEEGMVLRAVYSLFGWDGLPLPKDRIADMGISKGWFLGDPGDSRRFYEAIGREGISALYRHEMDKINLVNTEGIAAHPVIKEDLWPAGVARRLMDSCYGHWPGWLYRSEDRRVRGPQQVRQRVKRVDCPPRRAERHVVAAPVGAVGMSAEWRASPKPPPARHPSTGKMFNLPTVREM